MPVRSPSLSFAVLASSDFDEDDLGSWLHGRFGASTGKNPARTNGHNAVASVKPQANGNAASKAAPLPNHFTTQQVVARPLARCSDMTSSRPVSSRSVPNGSHIKSSAPASATSSSSSSSATSVSNGTATASSAVQSPCFTSEGANDKKKKKRSRHRKQRSSLAYNNLSTNLLANGASSMAGSLDHSQLSIPPTIPSSSTDSFARDSPRLSSSSSYFFPLSTGRDELEPPPEQATCASHELLRSVNAASKSSDHSTVEEEPVSSSCTTTMNEPNVVAGSNCPPPLEQAATAIVAASREEDVEETISREVTGFSHVDKSARNVVMAGAAGREEREEREDRVVDSATRDGTTIDNQRLLESIASSKSLCGGEARAKKVCVDDSNELGGGGSAHRCDDRADSAAAPRTAVHHHSASSQAIESVEVRGGRGVQAEEMDRAADHAMAGSKKVGEAADDGGGRGVQAEEVDKDQEENFAPGEELLEASRQNCAEEDGSVRSERLDRERSLMVDKKSSITSSCRLEVKALQGLRTGEATPTRGLCSSPRRRAVGTSSSRDGTPRAGGRSTEDGLLEDSLVAQAMAIAPFQFLLDEIMGGSALRNTASPNGNMKRERVYNTMFHVPWRVELLIDIGFLVCLDAFLYLFTVMPLRVFFFLWRRLRLRWPQRPHPDEICDIVSLIVLVLGVYCLHQADISFIYHWIRGQAIIKLYVVFNVLEIIDKLCQSFGGDVMQMLFNTAGGVAHCDTDRLWVESFRLTFDLCIAIVCYLLHSLIILSQAVTLNVAINSHSNALLTLLISNNFMEIKSNVFKRLGRENLHKMAYLDTVERFHITAHLIFVIVQNVFVAEEPWLADLASNAGMILLCEVLVDAIKHSFLAKFNDIQPRVYGEFLQSLCRQTLHSQSRHVHKTLNFVPLAPACVVARVMGALFYEFMPDSPGWWKWTSRSLGLCVIFVLLLVVKICLALGLQWHARWYLQSAGKRAAHLHTD